MRIIEQKTPGVAWKSAFLMIMKHGNNIKDGGKTLKEVIDLFITVTEPNTTDIILQKYSDKRMISWMVDKNFGGQKPVLNWGYSYGMRFRNFNGVDQINKIVSKLSKNPESKSATICLIDPTTDFLGHMPCIVALDFKVREDKLQITGFFRSQDVGKKMYADILALAKIQNEVARLLNLPSGVVKIFISSAHIYEEDFGFFES